jgi:hypothetical protein
MSDMHPSLSELMGHQSHARSLVNRPSVDAMKDTLKQKGLIHLMMWPQAIIAIHERFVGGERWSLKYIIHNQ